MRGVAHIGAYDAAIKCGVSVVEVAGTSAGSIVAVLIGAGANPNYLLKHCSGTQFAKLLCPPEGALKTFPLNLLRWLTVFCRGSLLLKILAFGGAYSSRKIEGWLDDRLRELLPHAHRPIKFRDLIIPTWVVASDLSAGKPKIWSKNETPDSSVGFAVRCSCSIPLLIEPVAEGTNLYVDGGMLSNLPAFVFADENQKSGRSGDRVLAFSLVDDSEPTRSGHWVPISEN